MASALSRPPKRAKVATLGGQHVLLSGPRSSAELWSYPDDVLQILVDADHHGTRGLDGCIQILLRNVRNGLVIRSQYSGMGTAESSVTTCLAAMSNRRWSVGNGVVFREACDIDPLCRAVLMSHETPPAHVYGDLADRLPPHVQELLRAVEPAVDADHEQVATSIDAMKAVLEDPACYAAGATSWCSVCQACKIYSSYHAECA